MLTQMTIALRSRVFALAWTSFVLPACTTMDLPVMSYDECRISRRCTVTGIMTARAPEFARIGILQLSDGRCVNVSLPASQVEALRRSGPREMTITGEVYPDPSYSMEVASMRVHGREIGQGPCGPFFVFVR